MWFIALVGCTAVQVADTPLDLLADPTATVSFDVDRADSIALLLRGDAFLAVDRVTGPDGEELWWEDWLGEEQLTQAVTAQEGETVLVWPVSPGSWSIDVHAFDAAGADAGPTPLTGLLQQKQGTGRALALTVRLSEGVELLWREIGFGRT